MLKFGVTPQRASESDWLLHALFLISSCPAEFHLLSTKKNRAWSKLIYFIVQLSWTKFVQLRYFAQLELRYVQCLCFIIPENWSSPIKGKDNWRLKFRFKYLNFIFSPFLWWLITDFYKKFSIFDEMAKVQKLNVLKRKKKSSETHRLK